MIEEQRAHFESDAPIVPPAIRIERQRLESSPKRVNEYMLPLDAAWEFPRENLELGKVSNRLDVLTRISTLPVFYAGSGYGKLWQGSAGNCLWYKR